MSFFIRPIQSSDYLEFCRLFQICFPERVMTLETVQTIFRDEPALIYVACPEQSRRACPESSHKILGFLYAWHVLDEIQILQMGVDPTWRRHGVGRALIWHTQKMAHTQALKLTLEVRVDNLDAIKLYEKTGFFRVGLRKNYYEGKVDGLLMDSLVDFSDK